MATVVNARDVILQAALPSGRVAGVTMQPNIVVDPSQVTGLGLIIAGTKTVDLETSSQVYQVATSGTATPSTITLTLNLRNIVGTPSISIISGSYTGGLPALSGGPAVYTASIAYANLTTDAITIRASVTESSITYTDDVTLVKARDGVNAVNAFLTNESHTVPSSDTGVVSSYSGAGGTFKLYQGSTDVSASATYAVQSNPNSLTTSINSTSGVFSVTGGFAGGIDTATVTYRATFGAQTFDKIFTITKSKAGVNGSAGARGSRTFYVSGVSVWSDATATSAASVSGGPIVNDVVTEYNTTNFSQTRFWNGTSWIVVNAVVDGNLLVSGTVGSAAITAGAIRSSHLLVTGGQGQSLNNNPTCDDPTAWTTVSGAAPTFITPSDVVAGQWAIRATGASYFNSLFFSVQPSRKYRVSGYYRRTVAGTGTSLLYLRAVAVNAAGAGIYTTSDDYMLRNLSTGTGSPYEGFTPSVSTTWVKFSGLWTAPALAVRAVVDIHANWDTNVGGVTEFQDLRVDEMVDASMVVLGGLDADRIDTRNLTIKDAAGTVIFSSGVPLGTANAAAGLINSNVSINSAGVLSGAGGGTVTIGGLDSTVVRSANPITSGNISTYIAAAAIGDAYISNLSATKITTGTMDAARITANTITTDRLVANAATVASTASASYSSYGWTTATSVTIPNTTLATLTTTGARVKIIVDCIVNLLVNNTTFRYGTVILRLKMDGSTIATRQVMVYFPAIFGGRYVETTVPVVFAHTPSAASHTYSLEVASQDWCADGGGAGVSASGTGGWTAFTVVEENKV